MSRQEIRDIVDRYAPEEGTHDVSIEGLHLFRTIAPMSRIPGVYPASLCLLVQGAKRVYVSGRAYTYDADSFLCCTMPLPVEGEVPFASPEEPVLGLLLSLETLAMTETLLASEASMAPPSERPAVELMPGMAVAPWDNALTEAVLRLVRLLDDSSARDVLTSARLREVYFALIRSEAGAAVRWAFGSSRDIARAIKFLHDNIREPLNVDDLARIAGMSKAVFHRRFKAATTRSPIQFAKAIRLNNAAALIANGMTAAEASYEVGYGSPSQFSREFSRQFGMPPRRWATTALERA